jgi:hypothetical protein
VRAAAVVVNPSKSVGGPAVLRSRGDSLPIQRFLPEQPGDLPGGLQEPVADDSASELENGGSVVNCAFVPQGIVVSSDLGQPANITYPDGLEVAIAARKREGISDVDIDLMVWNTPARLLGLAN